MLQFRNHLTLPKNKAMCSTKAFVMGVSVEELGFSNLALLIDYESVFTSLSLYERHIQSQSSSSLSASL